MLDYVVIDYSVLQVYLNKHLNANTGPQKETNNLRT
jgi:hypothetical protein